MIAFRLILSYLIDVNIKYFMKIDNNTQEFILSESVCQKIDQDFDNLKKVLRVRSPAFLSVHNLSQWYVSTICDVQINKLNLLSILNAIKHAI